MRRAELQETRPTWLRSPEAACTPGAHLFHVRHGIVRVEHVEPRVTNGVPDPVVVVRTLGAGLTISVPLASVDSTGLRRVIEPDEAEAVLATLAEPPRRLPSWTPRTFAAMQQKVFGRDPLAAAALLRDLHWKIGRPALRSSERPLLRGGMDLLAAELAVALGVGVAPARKRIDEALEAGRSRHVPS